MDIDFSAILYLLEQSPGALVYHLVIGLALLLIILFAASKLNQTDRIHQARHVLIGSAILFLIQVFLLIFDLKMMSGSLSEPMPFAIIEHLAAALTITWLIWTFLEEKHPFLLTGVSIFLSLAMILIAIVSILLLTVKWMTVPWELTLELTLWQVMSLILLLTGLILTLTTRPGQWGVGVSIVGLLVIGYILQFLGFDSTHLGLGAVRLAQTLSLPWMIVLVQRFGKPETTQELPEDSVQEESGDQLVDIKPTLVDELLKIHLQETSENKYGAVARAISLSLISDICYLVKISKEKEKVQIIAGYDLIREEFLQTSSLSREALPRIINDWEENRVCLISNTQTDIRDTATLTSLLRYHTVGHLLAYPLSLPEEGLVGGVIFLSPYTNKRWGYKSLTLLDKVKETLTKILFIKSPVEKIKAEFERSQLKMSALNEEKEILIKTIDQLGSMIDKQETDIKQLKAKYQIEKLQTVKQLEECQMKIDSLRYQIATQKDNAALLEPLQHEIRQLTEERNQLKTALSRANARIKDLESEAGQTGPIRLSTQNQILSLDTIAATIRLDLASQLQQKNIELEIQNPDGGQLIKSDPELMHMILKSLLNNAILASKQGGTIQLSQKIAFETGMLVIEVTDFGQGLTQLEQQALFSAEYSNIPGIGSIPAIREAIRGIRVLNGKIWLRSKKETFTTFRVQLPVRIID